MLACIASATLQGVDGRPVSVEVHVSSGLPGFTVVGLPDTAVRESRDRVRAALLSSGLPWPARRVTVNLAPSGVRKTGSGLDLAIAVGLLVASEALPAASAASTGFVGELGLDGSLRTVPGMVSLVAATAGDHVVVPTDAAPEAALVAGERVRGAARLADLVRMLRGSAPWPVIEAPVSDRVVEPGPDLRDVRGQPVARRALEIAAAGGHHLLMVGPPGSGKSMLAARLPGILPDLTRPEALEVLRIHSAAGVTVGVSGFPGRPPFRAPHHGSTDVALVGGGSSWLRPGEVSLAHAGVLFLDELGEFPATVLDALRQPVEEHVIRVRRARGAADLPARFLLVAAMNPCPCGEGGLPGACRCTDVMRERYLRRLSAPLLDRFDLAVTLTAPRVEDLLGGPPGEASAEVATRVRHARRVAATRGVRCNAELRADVLDEIVPLTDGAATLLERRLRDGTLSARGLHRVRRVARTVADLDAVPGVVGERQIAEALALRSGR
ncbi:MAG: YifB family Mg chelatase-like AAA ATPase, partial [Acidimicrobiales bacterium]